MSVGKPVVQIVVPAKFRETVLKAPHDVGVAQSSSGSRQVFFGLN